MKTTAFALAAILALSGAAFAKDATETGAPDANIKTLSTQSTNAPAGGATFQSKRFIDTKRNRPIIVSPRDENAHGPVTKRLGADIDPSVLPNF